MADVFTATWRAVFGWLMDLFTLPLPYFFNGQQLNMVDIVVGRIGIFVAVASVRGLLGNALTIAGSPITTETEADRVTKRVDRLGRPEPLAALPAHKGGKRK